MNELFENEYKMETKLYKEYVYNVLCKKTIIIGLIIMILGIFMFFVMDKDKSYVMLTAGIIAGVASIMTPILTVKQLEETEKRLNNGIIEKTNVKFSDNIVMNEGKVHLEFEYNQITKILQTKIFIVLKTSEQSAILVLKYGFLKGTESEFLKFIEEKIK